MLIGYRRGAGKLPLTKNEDGARGTWLEKRRALIRTLRKRGHDVIFFSHPTKNSIEAGMVMNQWQQVDLLIIEFAGLNMTFYGTDWAITCQMVKEHKGQILYLNDDPDLTFPWHLLPDEDWSRWTIAVNAVNLESVRHHLKIPDTATVTDLPYHALLNQNDYYPPTVDTAIYYGRPNGRAKIIERYQGENLLIAGKASEWSTTLVIDPPKQTYRAEWYAQFAICLALYDNKHAATGWRTGRAYHALLAGTVVAAPPGNPGLDWAYPVNNHQDLTNLLKSNLKTIHTQQTLESHAQPNWTGLNL